MCRDTRMSYVICAYRSPILKPKAHLHVFYCTIMYYAIQLIQRGFLSKTFKYEQLVARPHAVLRHEPLSLILYSVSLCALQGVVCSVSCVVWHGL